MIYFENIKLNNYRNFKLFSADFSDNCNVFYGINGSGKTNILEAISMFSKGKGLRNDKISNIIKKKSKKFLINSTFKINKIKYELLSESKLTNNRNIKKIYVNNDSSLESVNILYKSISFLFFLPETERLFLSNPSTRRNFFDRLIFSYTPNYNRLINEYNKNIYERSKLLSNYQYDNEWIDQIERNISISAIKIYEYRQEQIKTILKYLNFFLDNFKINYQISFKILDKYYNLAINEELFLNDLKKNRKTDQLLGGSKIGPHKSDFLFCINENDLVSQLSTGQQKTIILLIFLSHCHFLFDNFEKKPILLLDEICSHLDVINRKILLSLIEDFKLQVFMTGTTKNLFSFLSTNAQFYNITD